MQEFAIKDCSFSQGNALLIEESQPYSWSGKDGPSAGEPPVHSGEDIGAWPFIWRAVWLFKRGALLPACRDLQRVNCWREQYLESIVENVPPGVFLNAMAEFLHNDYHRGDTSLDLIFGMLLGRHALKWKHYFLTSPCFATRLVGLRYEQRWANACRLKAGDPLILVHETDNPNDANAVHVYAKNGGDIGYLRRTLAKFVVERIKKQSLKAYAGIVLGEEFPLDERVHIWIEQA